MVHAREDLLDSFAGCEDRLRVIALLVLGTAALLRVIALAESLQTLLFGVGVDIGADEETDDVEEGHPGVLGEELLGKG